jgi:hypothetical protein
MMPRIQLRAFDTPAIDIPGTPAIGDSPGTPAIHIPGIPPLHLPATLLKERDVSSPSPTESFPQLFAGLNS